MAIRHILPTGEVIETDTAQEFQELWSLLASNKMLLQEQTYLLQQYEYSQQDNAEGNFLSFSSQVPTPETYMKAMQDDNLRKIFLYVAAKGSKGSIKQKEFQENVGKQSLSGMGKIFRKLTGFTLRNIIRVNSIKDVYEFDHSTYSNIVEACRRLNTDSLT
ncbi:MAG TPA: hypothetical protein VK203_05025 [Nostocaceae cyanobacterium]|nr:hypothetical protein [Nostocaceae cyanobacterium]